MIKANDIIELEITAYAFEGKGIAKLTDSDEAEGAGFVVFADHAYPGDKVKARIVKKKKNYAEAKVLEVIHPSSKREETIKCRYFGVCGGCKQLDLKYREQLFYKQKQVEEIFRAIGGFYEFNIEPILASENKIFYRNKMEFTFSTRRWRTQEDLEKKDLVIEDDLYLGLHIPRIFDKVIDIEECFLQSELSNKIVNFTRDFFRSRKVTAYDTRTHSGFLRNLMIRQSYHTPDLMVNLVTSSQNDKLLQEYTLALLKEVPAVSTVVNNVNSTKASVARGEYEVVYYGSGKISDKLGRHVFEISPNSFFQTNTPQAENLYSVAVKYAGFKGDEIVYDLYCGAGTISSFIAHEVKEVYGFESVQDAVNDAVKNREDNVISNTKFYTADLNKSFLPVLKTEGIPPADVIMIDPPRSGMHPGTVQDILTLMPEKIVYVSCNPATQARDVKLLAEGGYDLIRMRPVDMFPHTYHIENVVLLKKK